MDVSQAPGGARGAGLTTARRVLRVGAAALLAGTLLLAVLFLAHRYRTDPGCCNSDDVYAVEITQDILGRGYERANWHLPYAPQLFPDTLLLLPCVLVFADVMRAFTAYSCLYFGLSVLVLTALFRQAGLRGREAFLLAGSGVLFLLAAMLDPACAGWVRWTFVPAGHTGAVLAGLTLWLLVVRALDRPTGWKGAAVFVAFAGLAVFADRLVLPQFLGPMALAVLALALLGAVRWRKAAEVVTLTGAAYGVAAGLQVAFSRSGVVLLPLGHLLDFTEIRASLEGFAANLPTYVRGQPVVVGAFFALLPLAAAAGLYRAWRARQTGISDLRFQISDLKTDPLSPNLESEISNLKSPRAAAVCLAAGLSGVCNLAAVILSGVGRWPGGSRYLLAALFVPFLFVGLCLRLLPGRPLRRLGRAFRLAVALYAIYQLAFHPGAPPFVLAELSQPYPDLADALDRLAREGKIHRGLASYWNARGTQYLTRAGVQLRTFRVEGEPWLHLQNPHAFLAPDRRRLEVPRYDFLVLDTNPSAFLEPRREEILGFYGSPREKVAVGRYEIWLYDGLIASPFTLFLRSMLASRCREQVAVTGPWQPAGLHRAVPHFSVRSASRRIELPADGGVDLVFAAPVHASLIDVGASFDAHFEVAFHRDGEVVGAVYVPRAHFPYVSATYGTPGNQSRLVTVPPDAARRGWTSAAVRWAGGPGQAALSHFLAYDTPGRPLSARQMAPGGRWRFESQFQSGVAGAGGVADDPLAGTGKGRFAPAGVSGAVVCGPWLFLEPGRYRVEFWVKVGAGHATGVLGEVDVSSECGRKVHVRRPLLASDFTGRHGYQKFDLTLETDVDLSGCEFRVHSRGTAALWVDRVELVCER